MSLPQISEAEFEVMKMYGNMLPSIQMKLQKNLL